jgi:hypothetical protein
MLDVDNPNNVPPGALEDPAAAAAIVTGAINITANATSSLLNAYNIISDESFQTGSRDDYRLLDTGGIDINTNEYLQASYLVAMRARWMSEQAIAQVGKFYADGTPGLDPQVLVKGYLMGAVMYDQIANMFDDANKKNVLGLRARVRFDKAVWQKLNPPGTTPAQPLVNDAQASADAAAALLLMSGDYRFDLLVDLNNSGDDASGGVGYEMNSRVEHTPDTAAFVKIDPTNKKPTAIIAIDPVTGQPDAAAAKIINRFIKPADIDYPPMTVISQREMYLILAEAALAAGNNAGFDTNINLLRAMDGMTPYTGAGPTRLQLLQWARRVNLVFQGRRLNDMYRFGVKDPRWVSTAIVVRKPGCEMPIPLIEREANSEIAGDPVCK